MWGPAEAFNSCGYIRKIEKVDRYTVTNDVGKVPEIVTWSKDETDPKKPVWTENAKAYAIKTQKAYDAKTDDDHLEQDDYFPSDMWLNAEEFFQS